SPGARGQFDVFNSAVSEDLVGELLGQMGKAGENLGHTSNHLHRGGLGVLTHILPASNTWDHSARQPRAGALDTLLAPIRAERPPQPVFGCGAGALFTWWTEVAVTSPAGGGRIAGCLRCGSSWPHRGCRCAPRRQIR